MTPLYTHPQRELSDEEIDILSLDLGMTGIPLRETDILRFARAVLEKARNV